MCQPSEVCGGRRDGRTALRPPVLRHDLVTDETLLAHGGGGSAAALPAWCGPVLLALAGLLAVVVLLRTRRSGPVRRAGVLTVGLPRVVRGLLVAAASLGVSLSGHVVAGAPPAVTPELLGAAGVLAVGCCVASGVGLPSGPPPSSASSFRATPAPVMASLMRGGAKPRCTPANNVARSVSV